MTFDGLGRTPVPGRALSRRRLEDRPSAQRSELRRRTILVAGRNFGCGSSREHAPQSIAKWASERSIAESFAEIFFGNSIALGHALACLFARPELLKLAQKVDSDPTLEVTIDLIEGVVRAGDLKLPFEIKPGSREALVNGLWDPIGQLLDGKERVRSLVAELPYLHF